MGHIFKEMYGHTLCSSWLINNIKEKRSKGYLKIVRKRGDKIRFRCANKHHHIQINTRQLMFFSSFTFCNRC